MDPVLVDGLLLYGVLIVSLVVHEAAHALTALWGGDRTAYLGGQVTLNPVPHLRREPFGTVILPIVILIMSKGTSTMGFAHAPIDPGWAYRNPRKAALMSAAGPISNFILVLLAVLVLNIMLKTGDIIPVDAARHFQYRFAPADFGQEGIIRATCRICGTFMFLNILLGLLNLIPFPPLDGGGIIGGLFPRTLGRLYDRIRSQPIISLVLMGLIFYLYWNYGNDYVLWPVFDLATDLVKL